MAELPSSHLVGSPRGRAATAASIEAAYRAHAKEFLRVATAIAGSREGGRDAVQEALTRAFARRATFRGSGTMEACATTTTTMGGTSTSVSVSATEISPRSNTKPAGNALSWKGAF